MNKLEWEYLLRRRYPRVEVLGTIMGETSDGEIFQTVDYRGARREMLASGLATNRMFAIQPAHWRTPELTELGCRYSLSCVDAKRDIWELSVFSGTTPRDGYGKISYLSMKGLKETQALLRRIFTTSHTGAAQ